MAAKNPVIQDGTNALQPSPVPGVVGLVVTANAGAQVTAAPVPALTSSSETDVEIEALGLADTAKKAAYSLKKQQPTVSFTSGKRTKQDQARAMASNVLLNRKWIEETYAKSNVRNDCQKWIDENSEKKTAEEIEIGLIEVLNKYTDEQLGVFSKHISGMAFDIQPVDEGADKMKQTIKGLEGLDKFLEKEGGLTRWHAQFK